MSAPPHRRMLRRPAALQGCGRLVVAPRRAHTPMEAMRWRRRRDGRDGGRRAAESFNFEIGKTQSCAPPRSHSPADRKDFGSAAEEPPGPAPLDLRGIRELIESIEIKIPKPTLEASLQTGSLEGRGLNLIRTDSTPKLFSCLLNRFRSCSWTCNDWKRLISNPFVP